MCDCSDMSLDPVVLAAGRKLRRGEQLPDLVRTCRNPNWRQEFVLPGCHVFSSEQKHVLIQEHGSRILGVWGQARKQFLMECAKEMNGAPFYLQALCFDLTKKENAFHFKMVINSVEEGRQFFKAVNEDTPPASVRELRKYGINEELRETLRDQAREIEQLKGLVKSTLHEKERMESKAIQLQQLLDVAEKATQEFEFSLKCCICKSSKVSMTFMPCQHTCCCNRCWNEYLDNTTDNPPLCPLCRGPVQGWMNVHLPLPEKSIDLDSPCRFADQTLAGLTVRCNI